MGAEELIAKDPNAYWDFAKNTVVSQYHPSPRVFPIPLYDPIYYTTGKMDGRYGDFKVANWIGFFLERIESNQLYGRIIPIGQVERLIEAIQQALQDPDGTRAMARRARQRVETELSFESRVRRVEGIYRELAHA